MDSRNLQIVLNLKDNVSKELKTVGSRVEKLQPQFQKMALAGTAALAGIGYFTGKAISNASDLEESINAVNVVFDDGAEKILEFSETASKSVGIAQSDFNQMATQTGALLRDTGLSMDEVADKTITLTQRAADMASVHNTSVKDALSAINQALRGETEAIRRYAADVTDATLQSYALSQGIKQNVSDMTQQEKRLLRIDLIMSQTEVTAGDFANTSDNLANQQRILSAQIQDVSATLGKAFIPIVTDALNAVAPVIEKVAVWVEENPKLARNIIIATAAVAGLVAIIGTLGLAIPGIIAGIGAIGTAMSFFVATPLGAMIAGIGAAIALIYKLKNAMESLAEAQREAADSQAELNRVQMRAEDRIRKLAREGKTEEAARLFEAYKRSQVDYRANGGPVSAGSPYVVGERGPELMIPKTDGTIIPNGGYGGTNINVSVYGDVSGQDLIDKVQEGIMARLRNNEKLVI